MKIRFGLYFGAPSAVLVFIAFFVAKIYDMVSWPWWLVTLPLWIIPAIILGPLAAYGLIVASLQLLVYIDDTRRARRKRRTN
jgi:hypothetical protein